MRILHVTEVSSGGVAIYVRHLTAVQRKAGHQVNTLTTEVSPSTEMLAWDFHRREPHRWLAAVSRLRTVVDEFRPDVLHVHSFFAGALARAVIPRRLAVVYQPHAWAVDAVESSAARAFVTAWERIAARRTDAIAYVSSDEQRQGRAMGVSAPSAVVGVPVDLDRFIPARRVLSSTVRAVLGDTDGRVVVCVGRLSRQKGQDRLAEAWERSPVEGAVLALVGGGDPTPVRAAAPTSLGRSLILAGEQSDVYPWLVAADAVIQASRYEGMSTAVGEALGAGRPVYSTKVNGAFDAITDPRIGAPAGAVSDSVEQVLRDVAAALADGALLDAHSSAARQRALALYDPDLVGQRIEKLYGLARA